MSNKKPVIKFADLFCGVGGFRLAMETAAAECGLASECVFSSDIDAPCRAVYADNFGETPSGDINETAPETIPDFDVLLAGFPCQPFSIIGKGKGFDDLRGTLFFNIVEILRAKRPRMIVLENVKQLRGHNDGKTLARILEALAELGYQTEWRVLNALDFGLPQHRERIFITGKLWDHENREIPKSENPRQQTFFQEQDSGSVTNKQNPKTSDFAISRFPKISLGEILETSPDTRHNASLAIRIKRAAQTAGLNNIPKPGIWHENKSGHISVYPFSCALRANSSHNYLLVDGERRLTEREMFRLQGYPDTFKLAASYTVARRQAGNSLPVPVARAVISSLISADSREN